MTLEPSCYLPEYKHYNLLLTPSIPPHIILPSDLPTHQHTPISHRLKLSYLLFTSSFIIFLGKDKCWQMFNNPKPQNLHPSRTSLRPLSPLNGTQFPTQRHSSRLELQSLINLQYLGGQLKLRKIIRKANDEPSRTSQASKEAEQEEKAIKRAGDAAYK